MYTDLKLEAELKAAPTDCLIAAIKYGNPRARRAEVLGAIRGFLALDSSSWVHQACRAHLREYGFHA